MADIEYLLPIIQSLKNDLVSARQYEAAKHIRDAERLLLPQGPPSMDERIKRLEQFIDGSSMQCSEMSQRIEKMEKALSQEMARTREMDDILAGVVKRAGYEGEKSMTTTEMFDEWQKCLNDADYFREHYCTINGPVMHWHIPNWMKAFEMIQPIRQEPNESIGRQRELNRLMSDQAHNGSIFKAELIKWLDVEIALTEQNIESFALGSPADGILATYKAVKAHIEG